jgi:hypothetical protein
MAGMAIAMHEHEHRTALDAEQTEQTDALNADEVEHGKLLFKAIDINGDGEIEPHELLTGLTKLGICSPSGGSLSITHAHSMVMQADANDNGTVDESEFLTIVASLRKQTEALDAKNSRSPSSKGTDLVTLLQAWGAVGQTGKKISSPSGASSPFGKGTLMQAWGAGGEASSPFGREISDVSGLSPSRKWPGLHSHVAERVEGEARLHKSVQDATEAAEKETQRAAQQEAVDATKMSASVGRFSRKQSVRQLPGINA